MQRSVAQCGEAGCVRDVVRQAERFIQSALREWAYGIPYGRSSERTAMLKCWTHHYNWHRPHQGIGGVAPITRLPRSRKSLLTLHS
jgi:transposase InsO family protein